MKVKNVLFDYAIIVDTPRMSLSILQPLPTLNVAIDSSHYSGFFSMFSCQDISHMLLRRRLMTLLALTSDVATWSLGRHNAHTTTYDTQPSLSSFLLDGSKLSEITSIRGHKRPHDSADPP